MFVSVVDEVLDGLVAEFTKVKGFASHAIEERTRIAKIISGEVQEIVGSLVTLHTHFQT